MLPAGRGPRVTSSWERQKKSPCLTLFKPCGDVSIFLPVYLYYNLQMYIHTDIRAYVLMYVLTMYTYNMFINRLMTLLGTVSWSKSFVLVYHDRPFEPQIIHHQTFHPSTVQVGNIEQTQRYLCKPFRLIKVYPLALLLIQLLRYSMHLLGQMLHLHGEGTAVAPQCPKTLMLYTLKNQVLQIPIQLQSIWSSHLRSSWSSLDVSPSKDREEQKESTKT